MPSRSRFPLKRIQTSGTTGLQQNRRRLWPRRFLDHPCARLRAVRCRRMTAEDIAGVAWLERACFSQPWSARVLETELANPNAVFFVAVSGTRVLGYVGLHRVLDEGYIANVAVAGPMRRHGLATRLMEMLFAFARRERLGFITLEVRESNAPAIAFYEKAGFGVAGRRRRYYANPTEDAVLMTAFLTAAQQGCGREGV